MLYRWRHGRGLGVFGVKRPARQPSDDRSEAGDAVGSSPNEPSPNEPSPNEPSPNEPSPNEPSPNGSKPAVAPAPLADPDQPTASAGSVPPGSGAQPPGTGSDAHRPSVRFIVLGTAAAVAMTAGVVVAVTQSSPTQPGHGGSGPAARSTPAPVRLTAISPSSQATGVDGADPIVVTFSGDMSPRSPKPKITPSVPGSWTAQGDSLIFVPGAAFQPSTTVTVRVPAGPSGVRSADGGLLKSSVTSQFTTGSYSQAGLAVLLAQQGYLPLTWGPERGGLGVTGMQGDDPAAETPQGIAYAPPLGTFTWAAGYPATLQDQWSPDQGNAILAGAVMAFESEHNMPIAGNLTPQVWNALFAAQQRGQRNTNGYTYAIASKGSPEKLTIWHNGQIVQQSLANTGIPVSPTVDGTFPVFERFRFQIMRGTNPDGSHYADPVQYVAYFNGGDAVHYFPRGSYGSPQSLGCVELDLSDAQHAWPYLSYGSLVTVVS